MEETDDDVGSTADSEAPSFAIPPGGMLSSDTDTSVDESLAAPPASDPFDLISMSSQVPSLLPENNASSFDVFASAPSPTADPVLDFWGAQATPISEAIDIISAQRSLLGGGHDNKQQLNKAESGDLLGLDATTVTVTASPPLSLRTLPPPDLMDPDLQQMPVMPHGSPPAVIPREIIEADVDPFASAVLQAMRSVTPPRSRGVVEETTPSKSKRGDNMTPPQPPNNRHVTPARSKSGHATQATPPPSSNTRSMTPPPRYGSGVPVIRNGNNNPEASNKQNGESNNPHAQTLTQKPLEASGSPQLPPTTSASQSNTSPSYQHKTGTTARQPTSSPSTTTESETKPSGSCGSSPEAVHAKVSPSKETTLNDNAIQENVASPASEENPTLSDDKASPQPASAIEGSLQPVAAPPGSNEEEPIADKSNNFAPSSPSPSRELLDESEMFDEVELASPSVSAVTSKEDDKETAAKAIAMASLKPPPLTEVAGPTVTRINAWEAHINEEQAINIKKQAAKIEEQTLMLKELEGRLAQAEARAGSLQSQKDLSDKQHKDRQEESAAVLEELQNKLQKEQTQRAEAESKCILANNQMKKLQESIQEKELQWEAQTLAWKEQLGGLENENDALIAKAKQELEDRKEHERRERVLANKLNMLKKQQASKTDVEDVYEDDLRLLKDEVSVKTKRVAELEESEATLKDQLKQERNVSGTRIEQLEKAVREEKQLNDERKTKMKSFIEAKTDELRAAKAESASHQAELERNNQSMVDLNSRWKTLHAQWVQSQTRNRELQRDLNKIKLEYENRHKVEDSLNHKLSRSANETEQHKNKRLAAKQELMSVLGKLEAEREITSKLRDSIRFTFTAKAHSQHQLLQENLTEFNKQLEALARRLGRPIPLTGDAGHQSLSSLVMAAVDESERSEGDDFKSNGTKDERNSGASKEQKRILAETARLLGKLENETQRISQAIMALTNGIEQMNILINGVGEKTCFTSLGGIFFGGGLQKAIEADRGRAGSGTRGAPVRYGPSSHFPTESGTMT
jgi:hypothetical protein